MQKTGGGQGSSSKAELQKLEGGGKLSAINVGDTNVPSESPEGVWDALSLPPPPNLSQG